MAMLQSMQHYGVNEPLVIAGDQVISSISPNLGVYATEPEADPVQDWLKVVKLFYLLQMINNLFYLGISYHFMGFHIA